MTDIIMTQNARAFVDRCQLQLAERLGFVWLIFHLGNHDELETVTREKALALFCGHKIKESAQGGLAFVFAPLDPMDGHADDRSTNHGQIKGGGGISDAAAVL